MVTRQATGGIAFGVAGRLPDREPPKYGAGRSVLETLRPAGYSLRCGSLEEPKRWPWSPSSRHRSAVQSTDPCDTCFTEPRGSDLLAETDQHPFERASRQNTRQVVHALGREALV